MQPIKDQIKVRTTLVLRTYKKIESEGALLQEQTSIQSLDIVDLPLSDRRFEDIYQFIHDLVLPDLVRMQHNLGNRFGDDYFLATEIVGGKLTTSKMVPG